MKKIPQKWLIAGGVVVVIVALLVIRANRPDQLQYFTAKVERGEIRDGVDATGTVNAVITVQVGSQVSGTIAKLNADFNSHVRRGDVVALIDPALFSGALQQATANLEAAKANVTSAEAGVERGNAALFQAKNVYDRTVTLAAQKVQTQMDLDAAKAAYDDAVAALHAAVAGVAQAKAQVAQNQAAVSVAKTNLDYTVIKSPIDGIVVARNVDVGQTVAASLQAPTIFTIAQDLTKMQVYAKVDESDVGRIKLKAPVAFKVDAFPSDIFHGVVSQVRMNATTVQNVVTYDAIIDFDNPQLKLFPGMTAYVTIPVATATDALKVPNAALRYKPPQTVAQLRALYKKYGIEDSKRLAVVWILGPDNTVQPVSLALGITDHASTEVKSVLKGKLDAGDAVITASLVSKTPVPSGQPIPR